MAPCIPAFQGGFATPGPPTLHSRRPSAAASLRRKAPPGDLPPVPPMRTRLPLAWQSEGAFTFAPVATHMPPSKPGGIRFYARNVIVHMTRKKYSLHDRTCWFGKGNLCAAIRSRRKSEIKSTHPSPCYREPCAHRIPVARSPGGALRRREAGNERNAVHEALGVQGWRSPPGARGCRGASLKAPLPVGDITKSSGFNRAGLSS